MLAPALVLVAPSRAFAFGCLFAFIALVTLSLRMAVTVNRLAQAEMAVGYTTLWSLAVERPELWYLHEQTKAVVSSPAEPRPPNGRKATLDTWVQERGRGV